jgi:hypothetical protein
MPNSRRFQSVAGFLLFLIAAILDEFLVELCKIYLILWPLILISHYFPSTSLSSNRARDEDHQHISDRGSLRDAAFTILWWEVLVLYWIGSRRLVWWGFTSLARGEPFGAGILWVVFVVACFDFWGCCCESKSLVEVSVNIPYQTYQALQCKAKQLIDMRVTFQALDRAPQATVGQACIETASLVSNKDS